jgi:hypothetical protein
MRPPLRLVCLLLMGGAVAALRGAEDPGIEFRGMVQEGDQCLVNLHDPATKVSKWTTVGGEANGVRVVSFDAAATQLTVSRAGRTFVLPLKRYLISVDGPTAPLVRLSPAEQAAAGVSPELPEYLRELPPAARRLLSEVRRRPAIRWPEPPGTATPSPQ